MPERDQYAETIALLLDDQLAGCGLPLDAYLVENSHLPGPAANFPLLWGLADALVGVFARREEAVWGLLDRWSAVPIAEAPPNDPREFLPFAAAYVHGRIGAAVPAYWRPALERLRRQARDPRWRTREMVAQGLQAMLRVDFATACAELEAWVVGGDLLEMRAAVAALAEPDLMASEEQARRALNLHTAVLTTVAAISREARRTDEFRALRQGLGYTLSVVVAGLPDEGWPVLRAQAASSDADVRWIVRENLKKNRLLRHFPSEVAATRQCLEAASSHPLAGSSPA